MANKYATYGLSPTLSAISYSPAWEQSGQTPAIGNGTISGVYWVNGLLLSVAIRLDMGTTTTFGSGTNAYTLSLPAGFTVDTGSMLAGVGFFVTGGFALDSSTAANNTPLRVFLASLPSGGSNNGVQLRTIVNNSLLATTVPFTWASGDIIQIYATLPIS